MAVVRRDLLTEIVWREALLLATLRLLLWDIPLRRPLVASLLALGRPAMLMPAVILAALWIVGGALLRAAIFHRSLLLVLVLRALSLAAGSAAVAICWQLVFSIARSGWPAQVSMGITSLFSLALYACWRWVSLLLAVVEDSGAWPRGWRRFAHTGVELALAAATNSTLKWFFLTVTALPGVWFWQHGMRTATATWAAVPVAISGYFAVEWRESIKQLQ